MFRLLLRLTVFSLLVMTAGAQSGGPRPPAIDMHVHPNTDPRQALERMKSLNIRYMFVAGLAPALQTWAAALDNSQFLPALTLPCPGGRAIVGGRRCWEGSEDFPDLKWLRAELQASRIKALGELVPQYVGIVPGDQRLEPYWQLAEEFDIPVAIHMGPAHRAAFESGEYPQYSVTAGNPLLLEEVLLRHKRLRLLVMHAGWPYLESMLALLYAHPNVYVDVAALQSESVVPRASYYRHMRGLVEGGFSNRIVFGSDFPDEVGSGIDAILAADFLSADQKADILCNNAARFLRLEASICRQ